MGDAAIARDDFGAPLTAGTRVKAACGMLGTVVQLSGRTGVVWDDYPHDIEWLGPLNGGPLFSPKEATK